MYKCPICLDNIYIFYYKPKCKCKIKYHFSCIKEWYKIKKKCIICKKIDNTNISSIESQINKFYQFIFYLLIILLITIFYLMTFSTMF